MSLTVSMISDEPQTQAQAPIRRHGRTPATHGHCSRRRTGARIQILGRCCDPRSTSTSLSNTGNSNCESSAHSILADFTVPGPSGEGVGLDNLVSIPAKDETKSPTPVSESVSDIINKMGISDVNNPSSYDHLQNQSASGTGTASLTNKTTDSRARRASRAEQSARAQRREMRKKGKTDFEVVSLSKIQH